MMRLDNCNFTGASLLDWVQEQDRKGVPSDRMTAYRLSRISRLSDGGIYGMGRRIYNTASIRFEGALIYEKE